MQTEREPVDAVEFGAMAGIKHIHGETEFTPPGQQAKQSLSNPIPGPGFVGCKYIQVHVEDRDLSLDARFTGPCVGLTVGT